MNWLGLRLTYDDYLEAMGLEAPTREELKESLTERELEELEYTQGREYAKAYSSAD